jgi:hypothetical protein
MDHDDLDGFEDLTPPAEPIGHEPLESTAPTSVRRVRRTATRLGISVPGAIAGALLVGALAFGANLGLSGAARDADKASEPPVAEVEKDGKDGEPVKPDADVEPTKAPDAEPGEPTKAPDAEPTDKPDVAEPTDKPTSKPEATDKPEPKPEPTDKPTPKPEPTDKPTPKPEPTDKPVLDLGLAVKEGAVVIEWSACRVDGAEVYKVVRSTDSTVTWPLGDGDELVAVVEIGGSTRALDDGAPAGKKTWYRVFCVRHTEDGYRVLAASGTGAIVAPAPTPKPTPKPTPDTCAMAIEAGVDGGAVVLHWDACEADGFSHYRIIRKADGEASLLTEIDDLGTTTFIDESAEPRVTYHYLVQAKGLIEGDYVLLGTTEWVAVTIE